MRPKSFQKFRLQTILVLLFVPQVVAAVGFVIYLSFRNGQEAIEDLANQLIEEVGTRVEQRLDTYLNIPKQAQQNIVDTMTNGGLTLQDPAAFRRYFLNQFQQFPTLTWVTIATEQPNYLDLVRQEDGLFNSSLWVNGRGGIDEYQVDRQGNLTGAIVRRTPDYDPRRRPWYQNYKQAGKPTWDQISVGIAPKLLLLSSGRPLFDRQGQFSGVLVTDFSLSAVSDFLKTLKVGQTGQIFILERSGELVATSTSEQPFRVKAQNNGTEELERLKAVDSQNPLVSTVAHYLTKNYGLTQYFHTKYQRQLQIENTPYFLQVRPYRDFNGLDWLVIIVIPEADFMARVHQDTRNNIVLCMGTLSVTLVIGVLAARWLTRPLKMLTIASEEMAGGNLNQHVNSSSIEELAKLANSFNSMAGQLKESFATLEDKVKARTAELAEANQAIVTLNEKLKVDNSRMSSELDLLREMQRLILPTAAELSEITELDIAGYMDPADEVGGDYYDVLSLDGIVTIGIGDVTGHGLESGILMIMTQTAVRTLKEMRETNLVQFLNILNCTLYKNVRRMNTDKNLTLAILNYCNGNLIISGQHEETIVVRQDSTIELVDTIDLGVPIGLDQDIAEFIDHTMVELNCGDGIVLYTDGITEAKNLQKEQYGIDRLCTVISQNWAYSAEVIKQAVIQDVRAFMGTQKQFDDISLLILKRQECGS